MPSFNKGSYTEYSNKIGLYSNSQESFISQSPDVVLNFPYKDCVLEGGMTKEDAKRDERFLNIKLDKRDIDTLFDPKVLTNFKYIDSNGERKLSTNDDIEFFGDDGELKQNLLIKGNNLVALHTLKQKLAGKVKLVYIDPPYYFMDSKAADTFSYNSNFKLSSWLAFMHNRLEISHKLLADDGIILISIDEDGFAYLKILMDELFGASNFICTFIWRRSGTGGLRGVFPITTHEYILAYAKDKGKLAEPWYAPYSQASLSDFKYKDENGLYKTQALYLTSLKQTANQAYPITTPDGEEVTPPKSIGAWRYTEDKFNDEFQRGNILFKETSSSPLVTLGGKKAQFNIYTKQYISGNGTNPPTLLPDDVVGQTRTAKSELKSLFGGDAFNYAKPEELIRYLIGMITKPGDIVLDFCLGSGTAAAVAHKMGRRWIGIEQMDYIETIAKERLKKVIAGEQGGISKSVNWQGGGSFVYVELKKYNQEYVDQINAATNMTELEEVYKKMYQNAFLKFWFDKKTFERDERFRSMDLNTRKQALISILDENQLYLNYADMDDAKYHVSDDERALTKCFYGDRLDNDDDTEAEE